MAFPALPPLLEYQHGGFVSTECQNQCGPAKEAGIKPLQRNGDKRKAHLTKLHGPFGAIGACNLNTALAGREGAEKKQRPKGLQGSLSAWDKQCSQHRVLSQSHGDGAASTALV